MNEQMAPASSLPSSYSARVDNSGRIVIPAELRDRLHVRPGDELVLQEVAGSITVKSYDQVLSDAQAFFRTVAPADVSLVDELLADRRAEVERERAEEADSRD